MLIYSVEFLRIADLSITDEKIRKRQASAKALLSHVAGKDVNHQVLLALVQGIVGGFQAPVFKQDSGVVGLLIKAIKDHDETLPHDLKDNAVELRAVASLTVGELLASEPGSDKAILAALCLRTALSSRPPVTEKHLRSIHDTLLAASGKVIDTGARRRRRRGTPALEKLGKIEKPAEDGEAWETLLPAVQAAILEVHDQENVHREEVETLWWMFAAYSDIEGKLLAEIASPVGAAFCSGLELARRALLPPPSSSLGLLKRAVDAGRKPADLSAVSFQAAATVWSASEPMVTALCPSDGSSDAIISLYPALFPVSWVCRQLRESKDAAKLGKEVGTNTGLPLNHKRTPSEWGAQVFREAILHRAVTAPKEA